MHASALHAGDELIKIISNYSGMLSEGKKVEWRNGYWHVEFYHFYM